MDNHFALIKENAVDGIVKRHFFFHPRSCADAFGFLLVFPNIQAIRAAYKVNLLTPEIHATKV
jgi:hypothetical protein